MVEEVKDVASEVLEIAERVDIGKEKEKDEEGGTLWGGAINMAGKKGIGSFRRLSEPMQRQKISQSNDRFCWIRSLKSRRYGKYMVLTSGCG